jgi:signal transduction histidine kinase
MNEAIRILLVDDDEEDYIITRNIIKNITEQNYILDWVPDYNKAIELINLHIHDVYLIDFRLKGENGLDLIRDVAKTGCKAPLILLTGQENREIDEQVMNAGASDYLLKGKLEPNSLERSIRYSIQNFNNLQEIQKLNFALEGRVKERTYDLFKAFKELEEVNKKQRQTELEVRKSLEKERDLNEMKTQFVTVASHEFRTPLTTILSSASLIFRYNHSGNSDKIDSHVHQIKASVLNLTEILNSFLSVSKLEEGAVRSNPTSFNLKVLSEEIKEEMLSLIKEDQQLIYEHKGSETVLLDKHIMRNIFLNLISNAIKYSEKGLIEIRSEVTPSLVSVSVRDQGIGIPEEDKAFLFKPFFRAQNSEDIQGTGLGLNIVKRYAELLNGAISFESVQGKGTIFKLEIPL